MSYLAQAQLTQDAQLLDRIAACAATHGVVDARVWAARNIWPLSAQEGWRDAYAAATADDPPADPAAWVPHAGARPDVITDEMIELGVLAVLGGGGA